MNDDGELSDPERHALAAARRDLDPPGRVEAQVLAALRAQQVLRSRWPRLGLIAAAAAVATAFFAGTMWERATVSKTPSGPRFALLLYGGETTDSPDRRREYAAWARALSRQGVDIDGEELEPRRMELPSTGSDIPDPRGFFIVSAATLDAARDVAASCPHLSHGGRIVIRPIVSPPR